MNQQVRYNPSNDYYKLFGLTSDASLDDVRRVYRQRAKEVHPDHNPGRKIWAQQQFRQITEAYDVLSDTSRRAEYDRQRSIFLFDAFKAKASPRPSSSPGPRPQTNSNTWSEQRKRKPNSTGVAIGVMMGILWALTHLASCSTNSNNYGYYGGYNSYNSSYNGGPGVNGSSPLNYNNGNVNPFQSNAPYQSGPNPGSNNGSAPLNGGSSNPFGGGIGSGGGSSGRSFGGGPMH